MQPRCLAAKVKVHSEMLQLTQLQYLTCYLLQLQLFEGLVLAFTIT